MQTISESKYKVVNMLRVLNIRWGEGVGGVESLLKDLAKYSDKSMYEMIFCFLKTCDSHEEVIQKEGCKVSVIKAKNGYDLGARIRLFRYLREINPDIIIEHGMQIGRASCRERV